MLYKDLVSAYEKLESTSKRLEKTYYLSKLLKKTSKENLHTVIRLVQGKVFPEWDDRKLGVAARIVIKAINISTGISLNKVEDEWKKQGDLGLVAAKLTTNKIQATLFSTDLTIDKVFENLQKLASLEGHGAVDRKVKLICELFSNASSLEAKFITRTVLEELRIGAGEGTIRDAIVWSSFPKVVGIFYRCRKCKTYQPNTDKCLECNEKIDNKFGKEIATFHEENVLNVKTIEEFKNTKEIEKYSHILADDETLAREIYNQLISNVQYAYNVTNDFGQVAIAARKGIEALAKFDLTPENPIRVMLAQKVNDIEEGFERVGKPCALEYKYDGFRLQCHKIDKRISLFTRRLENVTKQFPDVVRFLKKHVKADSYIIEGEAVGYNPKTTQYLPFQHISQRIRRKYETEKLAKKVPVELNLFDLIYLNGKNYLNQEFAKRREELSKIVEPVEREIVISRIMVTDNLGDANKFYNKSLDSGNEGIMLKKLQAIYQPGSRVGHMIKLKPVMESLDLVITSATWGEGKRSEWLTSFGVSCVDENGEYLEIGKVGTGIKELEGEGVTFAELTNQLKPLITWEKSKEIKVKPKVVVEIHYEEIQKSSAYNSGFALRFPRLKVLREERAAEDASTLDQIEDLFYNQRHKK